MTVRRFRSSVVLPLLLMCACTRSGDDDGAEAELLEPDFETRILLLNFSPDMYAAFRIGESGGELATTPLIPPGAIYREDSLSLLGTSCPQALDIELLLYKRLNDSIPIGNDLEEEVEDRPSVAGRLQGIPACSEEALATFSLDNLPADDGTARVRFFECSSIETDTFCDSLGEPFCTRDEENRCQCLWRFEGVSNQLRDVPPPPLVKSEPIRGRVVTAGGEGVPEVLVVLRTVILGAPDCVPVDDDAREFSAPILFDETDGQGHFTLDRPPGTYQVEVFSDEYCFRPAALTITAPLDNIIIVAELRSNGACGGQQ